MTDEQVRDMARQQATQDALSQLQQENVGVLERYVKPAVLPTIGGVLGAGLGTMVGAPFALSVPGGIAGASLGSMLGEGGNQALRITEPSMGAIGMAGAVPAAVGAGTALLRGVSPMLSGGRAAQTLNALAPDEAAAKLGVFEAGQLVKSGSLHLDPTRPFPSVLSSRLAFKALEQHNVLIPMTQTVSRLTNMIDDLSNSSLAQTGRHQVISALKRFREYLLVNNNKITPTRLQAELEGSGEMVSKLLAAGGKSSGASKQIFQAMMGDLDKAATAGSLPARMLSMARQAFKKESILKEIGESIEDATKTLRGQGGNVQFNANAVIKEIGKNRFYKDALSATERAEIESTLKLLNKIPALRPGAGATTGSSRVAATIRGGGIGGSVGFGAGQILENQMMIPGASQAGAVVGSAIGLAAPAIAEFGKNVAIALQMQTGRALMKELLTQSKGVATPQVASIIAAYAQAVRAGQVEQ